jgi:hypothetical protein
MNDMTTPAPETIERETAKLYVTDAELIRRLGVPEKIARVALSVLDGDPRSGFPRKQKLFGERRYWPAVKAWLDSTNGIMPIDAARLAAENRAPHPAAASSLPLRTPSRRSA